MKFLNVIILALMFSKTDINVIGPQIQNIQINYFENLGWIHLHKNGLPGWVHLPKDGSIQLKIKTKNADELLVWYVPGGSGTWKYRRLVAEDKTPSNEHLLKWSFSKADDIHGHLVLKQLILIKNQLDIY